MPTVVFFLAKMKLVTARFLLQNFKYAFLIIFVAAAVITPTGDMMTQAIFAAPMLGLYMLSIVIAWIVGPKAKKPGHGLSVQTGASSQFCTSAVSLRLTVMMSTYYC